MHCIRSMTLTRAHLACRINAAWLIYLETPRPHLSSPLVANRISGASSEVATFIRVIFLFAFFSTSARCLTRILGYVASGCKGLFIVSSIKWEIFRSYSIQFAIQSPGNSCSHFSFLEKSRAKRIRMIPSCYDNPTESLINFFRFYSPVRLMIYSFVVKLRKEEASTQGFARVKDAFLFTVARKAAHRSSDASINYVTVLATESPRNLWYDS